MKKRILSKALVLAVCLGVAVAFGGCGSSDNNDNTQQEQQEGANDTQDLQDTQDEMGTEPAGDAPVDSDMGTEENPA